MMVNGAWEWGERPFTLSLDWRIGLTFILSLSFIRSMHESTYLWARLKKCAAPLYSLTARHTGERRSDRTRSTIRHREHYRLRLRLSFRINTSAIMATSNKMEPVPSAGTAFGAGVAVT